MSRSILIVDDPVADPASKAEEPIKASIAAEFIAAEIKSLLDVIRRIDGCQGCRLSVAGSEVIA